MPSFSVNYLDRFEVVFLPEVKQTIHIYNNQMPNSNIQYMLRILHKQERVSASIRIKQ